MSVKVVQLTRKPGEGHYSIEGTFAAMRGAVKGGADITVRECPYMSQGLVQRIRNVLAAKATQGDIAHILGDVHYLAFGTRATTTVLTICDCGFAYNKSWIRRKLLRLLWLDLPVRRVAKICAISEKTKAEILKLTRVSADKIVVIPVCISDVFQAAAPRPFRSSRPVILQIGTRQNKNVPRLAAALAGIPCELHVVGQPTQEIEDSIRDYGVSYRFFQRLSEGELVEAYRNADLVSFVSTYEGFGMPVVEAQAIGRAVVTSDLEPMRSVAGGAAALADPYSVESIREQIQRLIGDEAWRESLISKGFQNVEQYRAEAVAKQYLQVYEEVWARANGR